MISFIRPGGAQLAHRFFGVARSQNLVELFHQPRRRAPRDLVPVNLDRVEDRFVDGELQACGEHDRPQHAHRIFDEPHRGVADAADQPALEIVEPADVVDDRERADVVEERVHGEVAAERVLLGCAVGVVAVDEARSLRVMRRAVAVDRRSDGDVAWRRSRLSGNAAASISGVSSLRLDQPPERGDLDRLGPELDVGESKPPSDDPAVAKELLDLMRVRGRADVEVLGPASEEQVAHAAADQVGDVVVLVELIEDFEGTGIDVSARNRVRGPRNDGRLHHRFRIIAPSPARKRLSD